MDRKVAEEREQTVCFTGHRLLSGSEREKASERLDLVLSHLHDCGFRFFIAGGALGFDQLAAERVLALSEQEQDVRLILAIPCMDQPGRWPEQDRLAWAETLEKAHDARILSPKYYPGCMQVRNRYMVNHSAGVICYLTGIKGGTVSTVAYAAAQHLPLVNVAMDESLARFLEKKMPFGNPFCF